MDRELCDEDIGVLKGRVAALGYESVPQAKSAIDKSPGQKVLLNKSWFYTFIVSRKGFYAVNIRDPTKLLPICPCQNPTCSYFTGGGLVCPVHAPNDNHPNLPSSGSSGSVEVLEHLTPPCKVLSASNAVEVIRAVYQEAKKKFKVHGDLRNGLIHYMVFKAIVDVGEFFSTSTGYTVLFPPRYACPKDEKCSLQYISKDSELMFYDCKEPGCYEIGTEIFESDYYCQEHGHGKAPKTNFTQTRNMILMGVKMLLEKQYGESMEPPFKPNESHWKGMLKRIWMLGSRGVTIPFAGFCYTLYIGVERHSFNYHRSDKMRSRSTNRLCVKCFCLTQPAPDSIYCHLCILKQDDFDYEALFPKEEYGCLTKNMALGEPFYLHEF